MGCFGRNTKVYALNSHVAEHKPMFETLSLKESHIDKLYQVFMKADFDMSGELSLFEMLDYLDVKRTDFSLRVFSIFDEDASGEIDFKEFVLSMWNYCTLTKPSLVLFAFDLYDRDGSGTIELDEMVILCKDIYGKDYHKNRLAQQILDKIQILNDAVTGSGEVTVEKFAHFCESHPGLLYPAFQFQSSLRKAVCGKGFWEKIGKRRVTLPTGVQVSIQQLLASHVDGQQFKELCMHDKPGADRILTDGAKKQARKSLGNNNVVEFEKVFRATGSLAQRRSEQQKRLQSISKKVLAANALKSKSYGISAFNPPSKGKPRNSLKGSKQTNPLQNAKDRETAIRKLSKASRKTT